MTLKLTRPIASIDLETTAERVTSHIAEARETASNRARPSPKQRGEAKQARPRPIWQPLTPEAFGALVREAARGSEAAVKALELSHEAWRTSHYDRPAWLLSQLRRLSVDEAGAVASRLGTSLRDLERQAYGVGKFKAAHDAEMELVPW